MGKYKKPSVANLVKALKKCHGNLSKASDELGVSRVALWMWAKEDEDFQDAIVESRKRKLDQYVTTAELVAMGIPDVDPETKRVVGWVQPPDAGMLKFFINRLGRDEGYGDNVDITTNGKDLNTAIQVEVIDKRSDVLNENTDDKGIHDA